MNKGKANISPIVLKIIRNPKDRTRFFEMKEGVPETFIVDGKPITLQIGNLNI